MSDIDQLHPSSFVETSDGDAAPTSCFGPRNIRNQPSRETPGILLQKKYIPETDPQMAVDFNLPFRNSIKHTEMLKMMYNKLDPDQQTIINGKISEITHKDFPTMTPGGHRQSMSNFGAVPAHSSSPSMSMTMPTLPVQFQWPFWMFIAIAVLAIIALVFRA